MIPNYDCDNNGVIFQQKNTPINYDTKYVKNRYDTYGELANYMGYLRLGYIVGGLGRIPESVLDVGYGNGAFLKVCTNIIPDCYGNDITGYGLPKGCSFVEDITSKHFDVITFFDSLEHFSDINIVGKLKCNYVVISVPWCHYYNDLWFENWKHRRPNEHLFHFNEKSLANFMSSYQFELINYTHLEDTIRKGEQKNILSAIFRKC
jgi:hypothetical protein